jgi:hypothetical protein
MIKIQKLNLLYHVKRAAKNEHVHDVTHTHTLRTLNLSIFLFAFGMKFAAAMDDFFY